MKLRSGIPCLAFLLRLSAAGPDPISIQGSCTIEAVQALALSCSSNEPCPLFLDLSSAEQVGPRILVAGNLHTGSTTVESILLTSDDGGRTWLEPHARIPMGILDQIQFLDFEAGWVNGHLLRDGTSRDAFLLLTTNGGKTWRRKAILGESRTGAIEQFWFDSRSHGLLALDRVRAAENNLRYELWESQTGGESWSIRQVDSKPVPFTRPNREPVLRIRSDANLHKLERRDGSQWNTVAVFPASAGQCKPPDPAAAPEPSAVPAEPSSASPQPSLGKPQGTRKPL